MKQLSKPAMIFALCALSITQTGCFGEFALTRKAYTFHDGITSNKFIKSLLFWIPGGLVYGITTFVDAVILNLIEFWSGTNPLSMNEGDHEMQLATIKGVDYRIEATKDTFTTTQLSGNQVGEVRIMMFDRASMTWKYSDSKVCELPVMTFLDDQAENIRVYTDNGSMDISANELQNNDQLLARIAASKSEAVACADR